MSAEIRRLLDVALIARARKTASTAGPNLYRSLCVLIERLCDEAERMEHKALLGAQPNNLISPPWQEEPPAPPVMKERVMTTWAERFAAMSAEDRLMTIAEDGSTLDALIAEALKAAPPVEQERQELERLRAFVQDIANQKMCEDEGEDKKCHLDSGPYCGTHDYFVNDTITAARSLLA